MQKSLELVATSERQHYLWCNTLQRLGVQLGDTLATMKQGASFTLCDPTQRAHPSLQLRLSEDERSLLSGAAHLAFCCDLKFIRLGQRTLTFRASRGTKHLAVGGCPGSHKKSAHYSSSSPSPTHTELISPVAAACCPVDPTHTQSGRLAAQACSLSLIHGDNFDSIDLIADNVDALVVWSRGLRSVCPPTHKDSRAFMTKGTLVTKVYRKFGKKSRRVLKLDESETSITVPSIPL